MFPVFNHMSCDDLITVKEDHTPTRACTRAHTTFLRLQPSIPQQFASSDPTVHTFAHSHIFISSSRFLLPRWIRFSSAQTSMTETDISNIFSSLINAGFPLPLEHPSRGLHYTQAHTQSLVDYVANCTYTVVSVTRGEGEGGGTLYQDRTQQTLYYAVAHAYLYFSPPVSPFIEC